MVLIVGDIQSLGGIWCSRIVLAHFVGNQAFCVGDCLHVREQTPTKSTAAQTEHEAHGRSISCATNRLWLSTDTGIRKRNARA